MAISNTFNSYNVLTAVATIPSGTQRLVLFMHGQVGDNSYAVAPTAVTINSQSMTKYAGAEANDVSTSIWGYVVPDSWSAGDYTCTPTGHAIYNRWCVSVFTGVDPSTPFVDATAIRINVSTSDYTSLTVNTVSEGWVHDIVVTSPAKTAYSGQTVLSNVVAREGVSYKNSVASGTSTMRWDWTDGRSSHSVVSLNPFYSCGWSCLV